MTKAHPPGERTDEIDESDDDEDFTEMNCGRTGQGGCSIWGTEYCDWSCPFSPDLKANRPKQRKRDPNQPEFLP